MRPLRLEVEGFTSFRERVVLDFDGLDLFAITGPTGAGKSSLIDAMVLALYGQVPRVGDKYKQLISQGAARMSVRLDFRVGGETYRVARTLRTSGASQFRLERVTGEGAEPLADREKEVRDQVQKIVGLDYEAFVRSVVLPQGQFDAFLKGKPEERRKILVALLNLRVYEEMQRIANKRATAASTEAAFIAKQLEADFAGATPESLETKQKELETAEAEGRCLEKARASLDEGLKAAQAVRVARREAEGLSRDIATEESRRQRAEEGLAVAGTEREALEQKLAEAAQRLAASGFDEARHMTLVDAQPRVLQLAALVAQRAGLSKRRQERAGALVKKQAELRQASAAVPAAAAELARARKVLDAARAEREVLHRRHAAQDLRRSLKPGEACPVCEQVVKKVPKGKAPALEAADAAVKDAEATIDRARAHAASGGLQAERADGEVKGLQREISQLEEQDKALAVSVDSIGQALRGVGFEDDALADPDALLKRLTREREALESAKAERAQREKELRGLEADRGALEVSVARAQTELGAAQTRLAELRRREDDARQALEAARRALLRLAAREGWSGLEAPPGQDEADVLEERRAALQADVARVSGTVARLEADVERLQRNVARAAELGEKRKALEADAALASTLAQHLQANQFIAHVQEEALRVLAEDGSRHLKLLSQGRYSLSCAEQDFFVVDHWNADLERSVKTLSGGETFLASLALALSLAERLAELSAEGRAGDTLESLFLDEGFGTLDPETLDLVVQAIETLHGGQRMVGVVTHLQELAERMPARVEVRRSERSATVSIA